VVLATSKIESMVTSYQYPLSYNSYPPSIQVISEVGRQINCSSDRIFTFEKSLEFFVRTKQPFSWRAPLLEYTD
jgi:hypothetical protein